MDITLAETEADLDAISHVLLQLRPQYDRDSLLAQIRQQQANTGYRVAFAVMDDRVVCVAGFIITEKMAWGRTLYVDDLVTDESSRSLGAGKAMINWLKQFARNNNCQQLHHDSNMHRTEAHRFYDREGFNRASLHFSITDLSK